MFAEIDETKAIYIPHFLDGKWGYEIYLPMKMVRDDGRVFVYRRGWVEEKIKPIDRDIVIAPFTAVIRPFENTQDFASTPLAKFRSTATSTNKDYGA